MSGGANKRREVLKFEGDDINEYMDGCVNGVTQNNKAIKAYPRAHMHRDSDLRVGMSAAPGYSGHMSKKTTVSPRG